MIPYSKGVNILIFCFILLSFGCRLVLSNDSVNQINIRVERASTSDNGRDPRIVVATVIGNVLENATINTTVATVRVYDDVPGDKTKTNYSFSILHDSDPYRQFKIDSNGVVTVNKLLDREVIESYNLNIVAEDSSGKRGNAIVNFHLDDLNDNAPLLNITQPLIMNDNNFFEIVTAYDPDNSRHGPPFNFTVVWHDPELEGILWREGDNGKGAINISYNGNYKRDSSSGKTLQLKIRVCDKEAKNDTCAVRILPVIIAGGNDNKMEDGESTIHVFSYKGGLKDAVIGQVYVKGPDDSDELNKVYSLVDCTSPYFDVSKYGLIKMKEGTPAGDYTLKVSVTYISGDRKGSAIGTVNIIVQHLPQEAIDNAGSFRICNITTEKFMSEVYDTLREKLADLFEVSENNVQIFSVQPYIMYPASPYDCVDVHFSIFGSSYKPSYYLNGVVDLNMTDIETVISPKIELVNIDPCLEEICTEGGCTKKLIVMPFSNIINTDGISFAGVALNVSYVCQCPKTIVPNKCEKKDQTCFNGGVCHNVNGTDNHKEFFCDCSEQSKLYATGPRCEGRSRRFDGASYVMLKSIGTCSSFAISFEFLTRSSNAVFLINKQSENSTISDYIQMAIVQGKLMVSLDLGDEVTHEFGLTENVSDGEWHRIDFIATSQQEFTIVLDRCPNMNNECFNSLKINGNSKQLNLAQPLLLGGVPEKESGKISDFKGCISNLVINGELYDLKGVAYISDELLTSYGCFQRNCRDNKHCLDRGECRESVKWGNRTCVCEDGYTGDDCSINTTWTEYRSKSYVQYLIKNNNKSVPKFWSNVKVMFITNETEKGELFRTHGLFKTKFMNLELDNNRVEYAYQFDPREGATLSPLHKFPAMVPHTVDVTRFLTYSHISLDGYSGDYSALRIGLSNESTDMESSPDEFYLGAASVFHSPAEDFQGCIRGFYWNDELITDDMNSSYNNVFENECAFIATCAFTDIPNKCKMLNAECHDFWKGPFCKCKGKKPLLNEDGTLKECGAVAADTAESSTIYIIIVLLIILLLLLLLCCLLFCCLRRRRRKRPQIREGSLIGENIRSYNEEGGGEEDQDKFNIALLRKPLVPGKLTPTPNKKSRPLPESRFPELETDPMNPPFDELRRYDIEGDGVPAVSLSSLTTSGSEVDLNDTNDWGPKFRKLGNIYKQ